MLGFIKKYQKFFFLVTAFCVCVSILFFGLMPRNLSRIKDETLYKTRSNRKVKRSDLDGLKAMLLTCNGELLVYGQHLGMQFFSEDFFTDYLVKTGFLKMIVKKNEKELLEDFIKQHETEKHFKPYKHPQAPFLTAESVWSQHAPKVKSLLSKLQKEKDPYKAFETKLDLFLEESDFSPFALWQFLSERESTYSYVKPDENLRPQSLSLFGYRTLQDWFGEKLINYGCQFIYEISSLAKQKGYKVTLTEAEKDLMKLNEHYFEQMQFLGLKEFSDAESYFEEKLKRLGMNRLQMISLWREILTFQQYFNEISQTAVLDNLTLNEFESFATQEVEVAKYLPPKELCFKSIRELAHFEAYLTVLGKKEGDLSLNFTLNPINEIAEKFPQIVSQEVEVTYKEVNLNQEALNIKVQDVWKWKTDKKNAAKLIAKFPKLKLDDKVSNAEYAKSFEAVDAFTSMQIDQFVRQHLLKENKEWLQKAFEQKEPQTQTSQMRFSAQNTPFKGLESYSEKEVFLKRLFKAAKEKKDLSSKEFCFDNTHTYQILDSKLKGEPKLISYAQLQEEKVLDKILNRVLINFHKKSDFKDQEFDKVKSKLQDAWLKPIKKEIVADCQSQNKNVAKYLSDSFYLSHRLYKPLREALAYYKNNQEEKPKLYALNSFWNISLTKETLQRQDAKEVNQWAKLKDGDWSEVEIVNQNPQFVLLLKKSCVVNQHPMQKQFKNELKGELVKKVALEEVESIEFTNH